MNNSTYRDMHLLTELTKSPEVTQRELSKRIGIALGLTNLMLRRLLKKGYIKISGTRRSRIRYLITPTGILEKSRLTYEFIEYSLQLYGRVRRFLHEQLVHVAQTGGRRVLLFGTGELAEIAFLMTREVGLELVGIVDDSQSRESFLGYRVQRFVDVDIASSDWIVVCSLGGKEKEIEQLVELGIARERIITLAIPGVTTAAREELAPVELPALSELKVEEHETA